MKLHVLAGLVLLSCQWAVCLPVGAATAHLPAFPTAKPTPAPAAKSAESKLATQEGEAIVTLYKRIMALETANKNLQSQMTTIENAINSMRNDSNLNRDSFRNSNTRNNNYTDAQPTPTPQQSPYPERQIPGAIPSGNIISAPGDRPFNN